ncbi:hypothetical protein [Pseudoalteromonas sp. ESRF-bin5]|uniref:hypothetical protein n=1 Tax=Pseudoalteromonas sp. ESRF-bin5 TaxID=2014532 RepID=UPI00257FFCED|nr:hypothetical protein [Pseudoalteromonas sp. ESRF-bin5]
MKMDITPDNWPDHYWNYLAQLEVHAIDKNHHALKPWDELAEKCMNLAIKAPFLKGKETGIKSLKLAAAFLKRVMSDFRGVWLFINWGYPYQAACVASSLYENALVVNCISGRDDLAEEILADENGDVPWKPQRLSKMAAQRDLFGEIKNNPPSDKDFEQAWKLCYHNYKLLCKMKHPTLQQIKDETSHATNKQGQFAVIPLPDTRESSVGLKQMIMVIAISKLFSAAKCFAQSSNCSDDDEFHQEFYNFAAEVYSDLKNHISTSGIGSIPIKATGFKF